MELSKTRCMVVHETETRMTEKNQTLASVRYEAEHPLFIPFNREKKHKVKLQPILCQHKVG